MLLVSVGGLHAVECADEILPFCDPCRKGSDLGLGAIDSPVGMDAWKPSARAREPATMARPASSAVPTMEQAVFHRATCYFGRLSNTSFAAGIAEKTKGQPV